jgi:hypothetical protein
MVVDVQRDLYSEWKEVVKENDNLKYLQALRTVGGDPISGTQSLGATFFLVNGWRIKPASADHRLQINGNIFSDPAGDSVSVFPDSGSVIVENTVSNLIDQTATIATVDITAIQGAIYIDSVAGSDSNDGTKTSPVATTGQARTLADAAGVTEYIIKGPVTLDQDHDRWSFRGDSAEFFDEITLAGFSVDESTFHDLSLLGAVDNSRIEAHNCNLSLLSNAYGLFRSCVFADIFYFDNDRASRTYIFDRCLSGVAGLGRPVMDFSQGTDVANFAHNVQFRAYAGGLTFKDMDTTHNMSVDLVSGTLDFEASCTAGSAVLRGPGELIGEGGGITITDLLVRGSDLALVRKLLQNKQITDPATGTIRVYDDDGSLLYEVAIYEDAAGTIPYSSNSSKIERREKLE